MSVTFFAGNDLLGTRSQTNQDSWFQLKNYDETDLWSTYAILRDTSLMPTLIHNALSSAEGGRDWKVRLVTPARIGREEIRAFLADPAGFKRPPKRKGQEPLPNAKETFESIIREVTGVWQRDPKKRTFSYAEVETIGRSVLRQIGECLTVSQPTLEKEIEGEIAKREPNPSNRLQLINAVIGVLSRNTSPEELKELTISTEWIAAEAKSEKIKHPSLISDPIGACYSQVLANVTDGFDPEHFVPRPRISESISEFVRGAESLFILVGESGMGKSWALSYEAAFHYQDSIRALVLADLLYDRGFRDLFDLDFAESRNWSAMPEEGLRYLTDTAKSSVVGSLLVFADDLGVHQDPLTDATTIQRLAKEASQRGIKLVISMRYGTWFRLSRVPGFASVVFSSSHGTSDDTTPSLELISLDDQEIDRFVSLYGSEKTPLDTAVWLRMPEQLPLRNPYLLSIFLKNTIAQSASTDIDNLLDTEIERTTMDLYLRTGIEPGLVFQSISMLAERIWELRPAAVTAFEASNLIESILPGHTAALMTQLRARDVLLPSVTRTSPTQATAFTNPLFYEHLLLSRLREKYPDPLELAGRLMIGADDGILAGLARQFKAEASEGLLPWSESVLTMSDEWTPALCRGLTQRRELDYGVLAFVTAICFKDDTDHRLTAASSLGYATYQSQLARNWLRELYDSTDHSRSFVGSLALANALAVNPHWAVAVISERIMGFLSSFPSTDEEAARRGPVIERALNPLKHVSNRTASQLAARVLRNLKRVDRDGNLRSNDIRADYSRTLNEIRGSIAAFGGEGALEGIKLELLARKKSTRRAAAQAMRTLVFERPEDAALRATFFQSFAEEKSDWMSYLSPAFVYSLRGPEGIADALESSGVLKSWRGSLAFIEAGLLARFDLEAAMDLLPPDTSAFDDNSRMLLREPLSYAWSLISAENPAQEKPQKARASLSTVNFLSVHKEFAAFAYRGSAMAKLGSMLATINDSAVDLRKVDVVLHHLTEESGEGFVYIKLDEVWAKYILQLRADPQLYEAVDNLIEAVRLASVPIDPRRRKVGEWNFRIENLCVDDLCNIIPQLGDRNELIRRLPRSWPTLRVAAATVRAKTADESLILYALSICDPSGGVPMDLVLDRDKFFRELEVTGQLPDSQVALVARTRRLAESAGRDFKFKFRELGASVLVELHKTCKAENSIDFIWEWSESPTDWESLLLSGVYRSSFAPGPLDEADCRDALGKLQYAVGSFESSELKDEYLTLASALLSLHSRDIFPSPTLKDDNLLGANLCLGWDAVKLYRRLNGRLERHHLEALLAPGQGYIFSAHSWIEQDGVHHGFGAAYGMEWIPPMGRLALSIISLNAGLGDYPSTLLQNWKEVRVELSKITLNHLTTPGFLNSEKEWVRRNIRRALVQLLSLIDKHGASMRLLELLGWVRLINGQLDEAEITLLEALRAPKFAEGNEWSVRYNLACVYCRQGKFDLCRDLVNEVVKNEPRFATQMLDDPDFENVRNFGWFTDAASNH
jgi:hypothetical protein